MPDSCHIFSDIVSTWRKARESLPVDVNRLASIEERDWVKSNPGESYTIAHLLEWGEENDRVHVRNREFNGIIDLSRLAHLKGLTFDDCTFNGQVTASTSKFEGSVTFVGCLFSRSLTLRNSHFKQGLCVSDCCIGMEESSEGDRELRKAELHEAPAQERSAWWPGIRVVGVLRIDRSVFAGSLNLAEARIEGPLLMRGISIGAQRKRGRLHLRQVRVYGDIDLSPHVPNRNFSDRTGSKIYGSLVLGAAFVEGRVDVRGIEIHGRLHLPLAHITNRLDGNVWLHSDDTLWSKPLRTRILAHGRHAVAIRMADSEIDHGVFLDGAQIEGQINARNARIGGDFYLRQFRDKKTDAPLFDGCSVKLPILPVSIRSHPNDALRMIGTHISGSLELEWCVLAGQINLENSTIGGDLRLRGCRIILPSSANPNENRVAIQIEMARVSHSFDLRGTRMDGGLSARGATFGGDLRMGSWKYLNRSHGQGNDTIQPNQPDRNLTKWIYGESGDNVTFSNASVAGEVRFVGCLFKKALIAPGLRVGHQLDLSGSRFEGRVELDDAEVNGNVHLGGSPLDDLPLKDGEIGTFFVSGFSFQRGMVRGNFIHHRVLVGQLAGETHSSGPHWAAAYEKSVHLLKESLTKAALRKEGNRRFPDMDVRLLRIRGAWVQADSKNNIPSTCCECCIVEGTIHGANMEVGGNLELKGFLVGDSILLDGIKVGGDLLMDGSIVVRRIDLTRANIDGCAFSHSMSTEIDGDNEVTVDEGVAQRKCAIPKTGLELRLEKARIRELTLHLARCVAQNFKEREASDLLANHDLVPLVVEMRHATVGLLRLRGVVPYESPPYLEMEGLRFEELDMRALRLGAKQRDNTKRNPYPTIFGRWRRYAFFLAIRNPATSFLLYCAIVLPLMFCHPPVVRILFIIGLATVAIACVSYLKERMLAPGRYWEVDPQQEALFLKQMPVLDGGLYSRVEAWLRERNRREDADTVYLERRLLEIESGVVGWAWHIFLAGISWVDLHYTRMEGEACCENRGEDILRCRRNLIRHLRSASDKGRKAFDHPKVMMDAVEESLSTEGEACYPGKTAIWNELVIRLLRTPKRLFEWGMIVLLGDGVRVMPALILWLTLFLFSWQRVFIDRASVDHPKVFVSGFVTKVDAKHSKVEVATDSSNMGSPTDQEYPEDRPAEWGLGDSFWVTCEAHVPLVELAARENWRPSTQPVRVFQRFFAVTCGENSWPCSNLVPSYETWAGIVHIIGWIALPVIIGASTGLLKHKPAGGENEE